MTVLSSAVSLWMIHGNLQTPKVWQPLPSQLRQACRTDVTLDVFLEDVWAHPAQSLPEWATLFGERVQTDKRQPRFLLGYSLGGRLAIHALLQQRELWQGAIIISADPGLSSERARQKCLARDRDWGNKFLKDNWDDLLCEWNAQSVFCGRPPTYTTSEQDFSRTQIAHAFQNFSKGHQDDLLLELQTLDIPILFMSGEDDQKYGNIGQTLAMHCPSVLHQTIPNAGHRVPWENSEEFVLAASRFLIRNTLISAA